MEERLYGHPMVVNASNPTVRSCLEAIQRGGGNIALIVDDLGCLCGVVTDGDLRRAWLEGVALTDSVLPYLKAEPLVVETGASRSAVLDLMQACGIAQIPEVNRAGVLTGIHLLREVVGRPQRPNPALILAGGRGSRLGFLTESTPKPMIRVAGRPIIERLIAHLVGQGIFDISVAVGYRAQDIMDFLGDGSRYGCEIRYLREDPERPLGTGGPLASMQPLGGGSFPGPILVVNGDLVVEFEVGPMIEAHRSSRSAVTIVTTLYSHEVPFGVVTTDESGLVTRVVEKPMQVETVSAGIYVVEPSVISLIPKATFMPMTTVVERVLAAGLTVSSHDCATDWVDVGNPSDLARARGTK